MNKEIDHIFSQLEKLNPLATDLDQNALSDPIGWIDTGCYSLNAIMSGSLKKGIPLGRIVTFAGPEACGKSFIIVSSLVQAQKMGLVPVIFDSESAITSQFIKNLGGDPSKFKYVPIDTVENCRNQIMLILNKLIEGGEEMKGKCIIAVDSLGNLSSAKELGDAEKDKASMDMGMRARAVKSLFRAITYRAALAQVPILFSNHTYEDPSALYPSLIKNQGGGSGPLYMSTIMVQLAKKIDKIENEEEDTSTLAKKYNGITVRALTTKNRFVPPFLESEFSINFSTGLDKYSGLLDICLKTGVVVNKGATYEDWSGNKLGYYKNWKDDINLWETKLLPELENRLIKDVSFSSLLQQN